MTVQASGRLRRVLSRFTTTGRPDVDALRPPDCGATPVADLVDRERSIVRGTLRTVALRPRAGVPALTAELYDGSGTICMVWLGRRAIPGIEPGRDIIARGLVTQDEGRLVMYNPRYDLQAAAGGGR